MSMMDLDPGQLIALHALLEERHVTRAARRLSISQSSMSHRLNRLRSSFDDELLVRTATGLQLTPRAAELAPRLAAALAALSEAVTPSVFTPATHTGTATLALPDLLAPLLPTLLHAVGASAPAVDVGVRAVGAQLVDGLAAGDPALALVPVHLADEQLTSRAVGALHFRVAARRGHPAIRRGALSLERWLTFGHVVVAVDRRPQGAVGEAIKRAGRRRRVALEVANFLTGLHVVADSDLLMAVPMPLAEAVANTLDLVVVDAPVTIAPVRFVMVWHPRYDAAPAHRWWRNLVYDTVTPWFHQRQRSK
jgi:DNA-binding transcriptional LysR family regulator